MATSADLFELMRTNGQRIDKADQGYWERFIEEFGADRVIRAHKEFIGREDYSGREVQQHELRPLLTRYKKDEDERAKAEAAATKGADLLKARYQKLKAEGKLIC